MEIAAEFEIWNAPEAHLLCPECGGRYMHKQSTYTWAQNENGHLLIVARRNGFASIETIDVVPNSGWPTTAIAYLCEDCPGVKCLWFKTYKGQSSMVWAPPGVFIPESALAQDDWAAKDGS